MTALAFHTPKFAAELSALSPIPSIARTDFGGPSGPVAVAPDLYVMAPPRLNFAGFCDYCGMRGCLSARCISLYESTLWGVCGMCDGEGIADGLTCGCHWGVVEVTAAFPGAVRP